jgi:hypothetical protein
MRALRTSLASAIPVAIVFASLFASGPARADEQSEVDKVRAAYLAQKYDDAEIRLREMVDPKHPSLHDPALVSQARMYLAAVLIAKKQPDQATPVFERILIDDPDFEPDLLSFPTEVIDQFIDTRSRLRERLNALAQERARKEVERKMREEDEKLHEVARVAMLERLAGEEKVTTVNSRWLALVPFGTGQFQNGDRALGWFFLATESACIVGTGVTVPIFLTDLEYRSDAYRAGDITRTNEYTDRANIVRTVDLSLVGAFAVTAVVGVVQAQVAFVPEVVEVRKRPLPNVSWTATPTIAPSMDAKGAVVGVIGRF